MSETIETARPGTVIGYAIRTTIIDDLDTYYRSYSPLIAAPPAGVLAGTAAGWPVEQFLDRGRLADLRVTQRVVELTVVPTDDMADGWAVLRTGTDGAPVSRLHLDRVAADADSRSPIAGRGSVVPVAISVIDQL